MSRGLLDLPSSPTRSLPQQAASTTAGRGGGRRWRLSVGLPRSWGCSTVPQGAAGSGQRAAGCVHGGISRSLGRGPPSSRPTRGSCGVTRTHTQSPWSLCPGRPPPEAKHVLRAEPPWTAVLDQRAPVLDQACADSPPVPAGPAGACCRGSRPVPPPPPEPLRSCRPGGQAGQVNDLARVTMWSTPQATSTGSPGNVTCGNESGTPSLQAPAGDLPAPWGRQRPHPAPRGGAHAHQQALGHREERPRDQAPSPCHQGGHRCSRPHLHTSGSTETGPACAPAAPALKPVSRLSSGAAQETLLPPCGSGGDSPARHSAPRPPADKLSLVTPSGGASAGPRALVAGSCCP